MGSNTKLMDDFLKQQNAGDGKMLVSQLTIGVWQWHAGQ